MFFSLDWMHQTATSPATNKQKGKRKAGNENIFEPEYTLDEIMHLRQNEDPFATFVTTFLKPTYSTKWKTKRSERGTKRLADIITVSDEAFVLLTLENNWERWIDMNNKAKNKYTTATRGKSNAIDTNVMPKYTYINRKRDDIADGDTVPVVWRGWNNEGILRFNELCKSVKQDRKDRADIDKMVLTATEPEGKPQSAKKRRKKAVKTPKAFVDSDEDNDSDTETENNNSESSDED